MILEAGKGVASDFSGEEMPLDEDANTDGPKDGEEDGEGYDCAEIFREGEQGNERVGREGEVGVARLVVNVGGGSCEAMDMSSRRENVGMQLSSWIEDEPASDPTVAGVVPSCPNVNAGCSGMVVEMGERDRDWDANVARMECDAGNGAGANTGEGDDDEDGEGSEAGATLGEEEAEEEAVCDGGGEGVLGGVIRIEFLP